MERTNSGHVAHRAWIQQARIQSDEAERQAAGSSGTGGLSAFAGLSADYFPGYRLEGEIHRGAQGVVYRAIQESTRRVVALKVLREGPFASVHDRVRIEREVQVLAQLRHPDIVAIHDSGDAGGHFYLVMDFVDGRPLNPRDLTRRPIREALQFFVRICDAVNAAHLRGVMHRDIKPGNILVDSDGGPHVVDFGLAKFTNSALEDAGSSAAATLTGQFVGSLPWCSPEQAEGSEIDVRTDVYSLGVLLYQMLTGSLPYSVTGRATEVLQRVRTEAPQPPRSMRGDMDDEVQTILLRCLQKERERRYQSAGELARDIRHYLADEPIAAKRDSLSYLLRKGLRRHWVPASVAAAFMVSIAAGLAVSLSQWRTAVQQRNRALFAEKNEAEARRRVETENRKLQNVNKFVQDLLLSADPNALTSGDVSARALLDNASREIDAGAMRDQSDVEAAVRTTLGRAYMTLGHYVTAENHLQRAIQILEADPRDPALADALLAMATLRLARQDFDSAEAIARRSLSIRREVYGDAHADVAIAWETLAGVYYSARRFEDAVAAMRESVAVFRATLGEASPMVANAMLKLANYLHGADETEELLTSALRILRQSGASPTLGYARALSSLARTQHLRRDYAAAEKSYKSAIAIGSEIAGGPNEQQLNDLESLALMYMHARNWQRALETNLESLRVARALLGEDSSRVVSALLTLSTAYARLDENRKGQDASREALDILVRTETDQSLEGAVACINLATLALKNGELDIADDAARQCQKIPDDSLLGQPWRKSIARSVLGEILTIRGEYADAETWLISGHEGLASAPAAYAELRENNRRRLVKLYETWDVAEPGKGYDQKAAQWREGSSNPNPGSVTAQPDGPLHPPSPASRTP